MCTAAGTPGTWKQIRPAPVTADPTTGTIPAGYLILNVATGNLKRHTGDYNWDIPDVDVHTHTLANVTDSGTAAGLDVPASGDAAAGEVVKGDDSRLTDTRTPASHSHAIAEVTDLQTPLDGKLALAGGTKQRLHPYSNVTPSTADTYRQENTDR